MSRNDTQAKANFLIEKYNLLKHPEGGYYKQVHKSPLKVVCDIKGKKEQRSAYTEIYFLLIKENFSAFHKLPFDETWHHLEGSSATIYVIDQAGCLKEHVIGSSLENKTSESIFTVPANCWFAAKLNDESSFGLFSCTVAPGFEYSDLELAQTDKFINLYPQYASEIKKLTRNKPVVDIPENEPEVNTVS
jgi:predicted cupin superfamily sugar epimerase